MRMGGGGGMRGGGGARFSGGGARHFSGGGGGRQFSGRPAAARSAARPSFRGNRSAVTRNTPNIQNNSVNRRATFDNNRNPALGQNRIGENRIGENRNASLRSNAVRNALNSRSVAGALRNRGALHNPGTRAMIAASAATAGWHHDRDGRGGNGWWRHRNGGYGWVGPLFWPFAYYDMYDYAMWGDSYDPSFWGYGYNDIYAGMFAPYGYDDLTGYLPSGGGGNPAGAPASAAPAANAEPDQLTQMCGEDSRNIAGLPIDQIQQAIQPNEAQRTALDELGTASVKAAQGIKAACPTQVSATAPNRLAAMQARIEAMIAAVGTVQPALDNFYGLLNDEQKARLNAIGQDQHAAAPNGGGSIAQSCSAAQPGATDWPGAEIDAKVRPTDAQRASLTALQDASARAADMLKASCQIDAAVTPPARLAGVGKRLDVMLQAVKTVRTALDDFYGQLTDEQKAQFEAIGPARTAASLGAAASDQPATGQRYRRHHASIGGIVRRLISLAP
jgi:hypothetical protein